MVLDVHYSSEYIMYQHDAPKLESRAFGHVSVAARTWGATRNDADQRGENGKGGAENYARHGACCSISGAHAKTKREK